jgi:putative FmdB family regulatory protein
MPIYEYKCEKCGQFETTQKITDKPLSRCPACKGRVKKLISHTSFQLKGTGWYITDYARKDAAGKEKKTATSDAKENGKGTSAEASEKPSPEKKPAKAASESTNP